MLAVRLRRQRAKRQETGRDCSRDKAAPPLLRRADKMCGSRNCHACLAHLGVLVDRLYTAHKPKGRLVHNGHVGLRFVGVWDLHLQRMAPWWPFFRGRDDTCDRGFGNS